MGLCPGDRCRACSQHCSRAYCHGWFTTLLTAKPQPFISILHETHEHLAGLSQHNKRRGHPGGVLAGYGAVASLELSRWIAQTVASKQPKILFTSQPAVPLVEALSSSHNLAAPFLLTAWTTPPLAPAPVPAPWGSAAFQVHQAEAVRAVQPGRAG